MPNTINFAGQQIVEPGVYGEILGQVPAPVITATYANVFLIDTGSQGTGVGGTGISYGGGSGVAGQLQQNGNSVYKFTNAADFQAFVRGGLLWDLASYLFTPSTSGAPGPQNVYHARAATTTAPQFTFALPTAAGSLVFDAKNEGVGSNGVLTGGVLTRGYGCKIIAGIINPSAFIIQFYEGTFRGTGADGNPYAGIAEASIVTNNIVSSSPEFTTAAQFIAWATNDSSFNQYFVLDAATVTSTTVINASVLTTYSGVQIFIGGTTQYSLAVLQTLLTYISNYDNSAFLCDDYGVTPTIQGSDILDGCNKGGLSAFNQAILTHIQTQALYKYKTMYIGGGQNSTQYTTGNNDGSRDQALYYNNCNTAVVHSGVKVPSTVGGTGVAYKYNSSLYNAAMVCGRIAGLQPQVPGTYKDIRIIGLQHELSLPQRVDALQHGVLHQKNVNGLGWVINQSVNTLQKNTSIIYNDGTSPEISIVRICFTLLQGLNLNALGFVGGNINTVSGSDLQT
ncbi:MAG TPA: hypothetical protein VK890_07465, partial [Bacteroidia bacterium]|nr:hypothetical protein [Bacteroidia bacterium]